MGSQSRNPASCLVIDTPPWLAYQIIAGLQPTGGEGAAV
jgi:hypothetical protein